MSAVKGQYVNDASTSTGGLVKRLFIGAGCNRIVNNVSWGACDLVAFGAQNAVAIFCPKTAQILTTLPGHKASVNCTQWLPSNKFSFNAKQLERHYLLSGDAGGVIILWELCLLDRKWRYVLQVPQSHKKGVTCITGIMVSETEAIFASTSSDCTIHVWEVLFPSTTGGDCKLLCLESLFVGLKPMVALSLAELPGNTGHLVLAMGGLDNKIHLYCGERTGKFLHACELKGHTDWIRSLDFSLPICTKDEAKSILLVSSSQDKGIRIWKLALRSSLGSTQGAYRREEISLASYIEGPMFVAGPSSYQISLESLLIGHEDWVYSVEWQPPLTASVEGIDYYQPQSILSASMDKTMMVWQPERTSGIWMNVVTVGELSHCALGFYGGHWSPNGDSILAHGYGGSFHLWKNVGVNLDNWQPQKVPSGHFAAVADVAWARSGEYILSVSHDQTSRIFASWKNEASSDGTLGMKLLALSSWKGEHRFVSGADEKVARVFEAPFSSFSEDIQVDVQILGANMSALGLSQKLFIFRDQLAWHTLWPESHKLYGHGNELFSLCCDHEGKLVARHASVSEIWLWQVGSWKAVGHMQSHSLTVTQMEFSHDDNMLLAVSRDRQFSVFTIKRTVSYQLVARQEAHKRIIWSCSWNPHGHEFATGSRDKTVKIWAVDKGSSVRQLLTLPQFNSSVTALSWFGFGRQGNDGFLAVGMESGLIELWTAGVAAASVVQLDPFMCHVSAVNRLAWKNTRREDSRSMQLASCGADHSVRVFEINVV
ncbi:hypothetical protein I3842_Q119100 [Carya illinoinensis]|uniref:Elongator complex protein 2 n=1 Tax=Carya illinoinensis TaxID=32201 RepID=A0A922A1Q1_CARIL|nr:hypothetical protein I3842_Q119100 [Carya illinoinensis]